MKQWTSLGGTTALLLVLTGAAQAEVSAAEVWNNWRAAAEGMGQTLTTGSESQDGDTLMIRDLTVAMQGPDMNMSGVIDMIALRDQGDGTVQITVSPTYDMHITGTSEDGEAIDATVQVRQPGITLIASGGIGNVAYDFTAPEIGISLVGLTVDNAPLEMVFDVLASTLSGRYEMVEGALNEVTSSLNAALVKVNVDANEPGGTGTFKLNADFADVSMASDGSLLMMDTIEDLSSMLARGFATSADFAHGGSTYAIDFQDEAEAFRLNGTSDSGSLSLSLDADAIGYDVNSKGLAFTLSGSEIPLPEIAASFTEFGTGFLMPLSESETPQDFAASLTLDGLTVSDMIWSMFDPASALPHDPASFIVDISGTANWLIDILDPEATEELDAQMPAELHTLDLNNLKIAIAGAILTGMGGFTFDNEDLETFEGIPAPDGSIDLKLVGGNALIDALVAMGMIPEDQAMGARMMLGLFARPGDGPDTLTSKIEIKPDGSITANGQRLQ